MLRTRRTAFSMDAMPLPIAYQIAAAEIAASRSDNPMLIHSTRVASASRLRFVSATLTMNGLSSGIFTAIASTRTGASPT